MKITIETKDQTHECFIPQTWNELSLKQLMLCYGILMTDGKNLLDAEELIPAKKIAILNALGIPMKVFKRWEQDCIEAYGAETGSDIFKVELQEVLATVDFLFEKLEKENEEDPDRYRINLGLTKNPFSRIDGPKRIRWYGPADGLDNLSIYELGVCFTLFESYLLENKLDAIDTLIATLWRPGKKNSGKQKRSNFKGDRRLPYLHHESTVPARAEMMQKLPKACKQLILFWFASCRQEIVQSHPNVFNRKTTKKKGKDYGWGGVIMSLAGDLSNIDQVAKQNQETALIYLSFLEEGRDRR